jgi:hypothetical protein
MATKTGTGGHTMSELGDTLKTLKAIATGTGRTEDLTRDLGISVNTLRRRIADLRHLGAVITPVRASGAKTGPWAYKVENWRQIRPMVNKWSRLEQDREQVIERGLDR